MIYLQESASAQTVKFIARSLETGSASISVYDEQKKVSTAYAVTLQTDRYYTFFSLAIPVLKENRFYTISVSYSDSEIFRGKIFVTNQTVEDYSVNDMSYTSRSSATTYKLRQ
jgi:hypothetical protein